MATKPSVVPKKQDASTGGIVTLKSLLPIARFGSTLHPGTKKANRKHLRINFRTDSLFGKLVGIVKR